MVRWSDYGSVFGLRIAAMVTADDGRYECLGG
jgi:hypothetical protein